MDRAAVRAILEAAHTQAAPACGRLALMLASGRGLSPIAIKETVLALNGAAQTLLSILEKKNDVKP